MASERVLRMSTRDRISSPWDSDSPASRKISVGTYSLSVAASGPARQPGQPIVLCIPGLGTSALQWYAVRVELDRFVRNIIYDRSGYGDSEADPASPTIISAKDRAHELSVLLREANIQPPFIIVCHSFGGIISREFLAMLDNPSKDVFGLVLVDANQERSPTFWTTPAFYAVIQNVNYHDVVGHTANHKLPPDVWAKALAGAATPKHLATHAAELAGIVTSYGALGTHKQMELSPPLLRDGPVSVLLGHTGRDLQALYTAGVATGGGSPEDRAAFEKELEGFQERDNSIQLEALKLSTLGRSSVAEKSGHNVIFTEPEVIAEEVKWVLEGVQSLK